MEPDPQASSKCVPGTGLQPNPQLAAIPNEQTQRDRRSNRPRNSIQAQPGSFHNSQNLKNRHRVVANGHPRETSHGSRDWGNKDHRVNGAPNRGGRNVARDRSVSSAPHTNARTQGASQGNVLSDRIKSQVCAYIQENEHRRPISVPSDHDNESPQSAIHPQATANIGGGNAPVSNSFHPKRGGWQNDAWKKSANETTKAHPQNQDEEYEQSRQALNKPPKNAISADENGLKQTSLPSESKASLASAASSLPDQPRGPNKSYPSNLDQPANHHQQINAALNSSNQQSDTPSQAEGNSTIQTCNMEDKQLVHKKTRPSKELHKSEGLRECRPANNKGSPRGTSSLSRGWSSAAESHEETLTKGWAFDQSDLDPVVNDNPYRRINLRKLPKYHCPGTKKITESKPLRRTSNVPSHYVSRNAPQENKLAHTGTKESIDPSWAITNSSEVAYEAGEATSNHCDAACTDAPSAAASRMAAQSTLQPANGGASQILSHRPTDGHSIEREKHHQAVPSQPQGLSEAAPSTAALSTAASLSLKTQVSSCDQHPNGDRKTQSLSSTVLPPHLRYESGKKAVAVPKIFSSTTGVNQIMNQKADDLSEDTLSRKETNDSRNLGHGLENIVNSSAPIAKVDKEHKTLASMPPHTDPVPAGQAPDPVEKAASNENSAEANWEGAWQDPPIGNDWNMRPQHPVKERKAVTYAFAEEQAMDPEAAMPAVDMHSPGFLSGMPVLDDEGVHELNLNETRPRLKARPNGHASKSSKTAEDRVKEHVMRVADVDIVQPAAMTVEEKREIRRMIIKEHRNRPSPPNLHPPTANIYLRPVETKDVRQITDLWNHLVTNTTDVPQLDIDETVFWYNEIKRVIEDHEPFLVAIIKGDNSSRSFREARRLREESVVGFARATDYGAADTVHRYTVDLEVFVKDGHMRKGIGACLFDRMMNALSPRYDAKNGVPLICTPKGGESSWKAGQWRSVKTILITLLGQDNDEAVAWKKKWLEKEDFHQCGFVPNIGFKVSKL